jgi:hypothetical protein
MGQVMSKKISATDEEIFSGLLNKCERRCEAEFRVAKNTSYGRCPENHLQKSSNPNHKGICQLTTVTMGRTKKLFCQWHATELLEQIRHAPVVSGGRAVVEDSTQMGMFK